MESSVFFKSQMSEKDYLYDFNTKQLTIVDPIVESLFNLTWVRYKQINISLKIRNIAIKVLNL